MTPLMPGKEGSGLVALRAGTTLRTPPLTDPRVMTGEQHLRDRPPPVRRRPRVVGVLGPALERLRERLLHRRLHVAQGTRQLAEFDPTYLHLAKRDAMA